MPQHPIFFIEKVADALKNGILGETDEFWTEYNGSEPIYLGRATKSGDTLSFTVNGVSYTLTGNQWSPSLSNLV